MPALSAEDRGAAAVEFALVLLLLVPLLFGIVEFGRAYMVQVQLTGAAREGARAMAIDNDVTSARDATRAAAPTLAPVLADGEIVVTPTDCVLGATATITATRTLTYNIPLFGNANLDLRGTGAMRCGG